MTVELDSGIRSFQKLDGENIFEYRTLNLLIITVIRDMK
jgi:hypothetical protein